MCLYLCSDLVYDQLAARATIRQTMARRAGTRANHRSTLKTLLRFTKAHRLNVRDLTPYNIVVFIEHLALTASSPDTIRNYMSNVRQCFIKLRIPTHALEDVVVRDSMAAIKSSLRHECTPSEPVPPMLLRHIIQYLEHDIRNTPIVAFALVSFCTLLRQSSVTPRNAGARGFDTTRYMCRKDLTHDGNGFVIDSKWAKCDQASMKARHSKRLPVIEGSILCPTRALHKLLQYTPTRDPDQPLLVFEDGGVMPSSYISRRWADTVTSLGLPKAPLSLHCLRKSGVDYLMQTTNDEELIRTFGDWRSNQVRRYYRSRANQKANAAYEQLSLLPKLRR